MSILYDEGQQAIASESRRVAEARSDKARLLALLEVTGAYDHAFWQTAIGVTPLAGELRIEVSNGETILSGDTNGDHIADFNIIFASQPLLAPTDFIL